MKITAPDPSFSGEVTHGPVELQFVDGVAELDDTRYGDRAQLNSVLGYMRSRGYGVGIEEPVPVQDEPQADGAEPKGAALDAALEDAGLSKSGTADEKRARLAGHRAEQEEATA